MQPDAAQRAPIDVRAELAIRVVLRRRIDRPAQAELERYLRLHPGLREPIPPEEFGRLFGAGERDIRGVSAFLAGGGLRIVDESSAIRTIIASGTVSELNALFGIQLEAFRLGDRTYTSYSGELSVPRHVAETIVGVLGLDTRVRAGSNQSTYPYPELTTNTVQTMTNYYRFPQGDGSGQLIVIVSNDGGFYPDDLTAYSLRSVTSRSAAD